MRLITSEAIGPVGVNVALVPHLKLFNQLLPIDAIEFVRQPRDPIKPGVQCL